MKVTPTLYSDMQRQASPKSKSYINIPCAFAIGGTICTIGQIILSCFRTAGFPQEQAACWTSIILVGCSAVLTALGLYGKIARHAGAGTMVPITGFANAIASSAIEARTEGMILGVGAKIFTIAGPVILYGTSAAVLYGLLYWVAGLF